MSFIYFGSGHFSQLVLNGLLIQGCSPSLVVSQPDRPKDRGLKFLPSPVGALAAEKNLALVKPENIKAPEFFKLVKDTAPDYILVADYGRILPMALLDCSKTLSFAVHPSLLPSYRGATPLNRPIINGDKQTGVTIFKMASTMDSGPIIDQAAIAITEHDTVLTITEKLGPLGAKLAAEVLLSGKFELIPQDADKATYAPKFVKEDGCIDWHKPAQKIYDFIRGTLGWPSAYTVYHAGKLQILEIVPIAAAFLGEAGTVVGVSKDGIDIATGEGIARLLRVKPEGKGAMHAYAFACGHRIKIGDSFDG